MKVKRWLWIFAVLSLLTVVFIWGNSLPSIAESKVQSTAVAEKVQPIVDPQQKIEPPTFHNYLRKAAHLLEFFVLGLFVCGFTICLGLELKKRLISLPVLIVLLVAVGDEFIQNFAERGSQVTDVVLDFAGALGGLLAAVLIYKIIQKIKKK